MKKNNSGFSIIIGMGLVLVLSITAYVLLSHIVPFSKNVKGIENASNAYYTSYAGVEQALYHVKTRSQLISETGSALPVSATWFSYQTYSSWNMIPKPGEGNSEYDSNFNMISMTDPVQLEIGRKSTGLADIDWSTAHVNFIFKVPSIKWASTLTLSWWTLPIINWMLSTGDDTLYASGSYVTAAEVNNSNNTTTKWNIAFKDGFTLSGSALQFQDFHDNCNGVNSWCTLKLAIVNPLILTNGTQIPYLEYKIDLSTGNNYKIPDRYSIIKASGKSFGFQKDLEVQVPQQTINQALDFTVFQ